MGQDGLLQKPFQDPRAKQAHQWWLSLGIPCFTFVNCAALPREMGLCQNSYIDLQLLFVQFDGDPWSSGDLKNCGSPPSKKKLLPASLGRFGFQPLGSPFPRVKRPEPNKPPAALDHMTPSRFSSTSCTLLAHLLPNPPPPPPGKRD